MPNKIFDDWNTNCDDCQYYWTDQCDGTKADTDRKCPSYNPTRERKFSTRLSALEWAHCILWAAFIIHLVGHIILKLGGLA